MSNLGLMCLFVKDCRTILSPSYYWNWRNRENFPLWDTW